MLLAFPEPDVAAVVDVGEHIENDRRRDVYGRLYDALGIDAPELGVQVPGDSRERDHRSSTVTQCAAASADVRELEHASCRARRAANACRSAASAETGRLVAGCP